MLNYVYMVNANANFSYIVDFFVSNFETLNLSVLTYLSAAYVFMLTYVKISDVRIY